MTGLLVRCAEVEGRRVDVRVAAGRIVAVGPDLDRAGEEVIDADGGALLPGLVDHHLHLFALAAAQSSTRCGPPTVYDRPGLAVALATARADTHGWVRGVGYDETVAGPLDRDALDDLHRDRPVRVQDRSGALWTVNGAGVRELGLWQADHPGVERDLDGRPTGRLWRADGWLRTRLPHGLLPDLGPIGEHLARLGVTAVTDATPDLDEDALGGIASAVETGTLAQRVTLLGLPLGRSAPGGITAGPHKIVLADSGLPGLDALTALIRTAHDAGRGVAVHSVTRESLVLLCTALDEAGSHPADRVEHAALVPDELVGDLARRGLRVVTQPGFLSDRGDRYLSDLPPSEHSDLYRCRTFLDGGVPLALSSDAPYGPLDPWAVIAAAVDRRVPGGAVLNPAERLTAGAALDAYLAAPHDPGGPPRRVTAGAPADLMLLHAPLREVLAAPDAGSVRTTLVAGVRAG